MKLAARSAIRWACGRFRFVSVNCMFLSGRLPRIASAVCGLMIACCCATAANAQLRVVTYNTGTGQADNPATGQTARAGISTILAAIGMESVNSIAKPIDVLLLQEQYTMEKTTQSFVDALNSLYGAGVYARSTINAGTSSPNSDAGRPGLVYNTQTVQLISEQALGTATTTGQPRQTMRYRLRPIGYDVTAELYAYNSHYKADTGTVNNNRRLVEAQVIRADSDALGVGVQAIYAGDYNIQSSGQAMYQHLRSEGNGKAFDPIERDGSWHADSGDTDSEFKSLHTQAPAVVRQYTDQTLGGMDDRFDFQLITAELRDDEGLSYIPGSYRAFGNNGTHTCCDSPITTGTGAAPAVLDALMKSSDHLPVVADYQLPAMMGVEVAAMPTTVTLGASITVGITISNIANVVAVNGADELDYTLSVSGDLFGGATGIDFAFGGGNVHQVGLNTATPGVKSGVITVSSSSQGAAHALQTFPVSFEVLAPFLAADFDENGFVDGDDLATWKMNFGLASGATKTTGDANLDGFVDGADFLLWQRQFNAASSEVASSSVPEPTAGVLLVVGFALLFRRRRGSV